MQGRAQTASDVPVLHLEGATIDVGEEARLKLILKSAPTGLQKYDLVIEVRNGSIARILSARGVAIDWAFFQVIAQTNTSIEIRALDLLNTKVRPGDENVTLAEIGVVGLASGRTELDVTVKLFTDDEQHEVLPRVETGTLVVRSSEPMPIGDSPNPPQDLDGDGLYEDVNGDGSFTHEDVLLLAFNIDGEAVQSQKELFDFDLDGDVDMDDAQVLAELLDARTPSDTVLRVESIEVQAGRESTVRVILVHAPKGLQKYDILLSLSDPRVAQIVGVNPGAIDARFTQIASQSPQAIRVRAVDFARQVEPGARDVTLVSIVLRGTGEGSASLDLDVRVMTDDEGVSLEPRVESGRVETTVALAPIGDSPAPPNDLDGDGLYEDIDGDGALTFDDPVVLAFNLDSEVVQSNPALFDFEGDGDVDFDDAVALVRLVEQRSSG
jgi:PKD repeat protein